MRSHLDDGKDFFTYEPYHWDVIVSNPPFTNKRKFFERALSFNKPFALIMTNTWLNDSAPKQLFKDIDLQLLMFDKRMEFIQPNGQVSGKITFSSSYYCWNFLPKQIIMHTAQATTARVVRSFFIGMLGLFSTAIIWQRANRITYTYYERTIQQHRQVLKEEQEQEG